MLEHLVEDQGENFYFPTHQSSLCRQNYMRSKAHVKAKPHYLFNIFDTFPPPTLLLRTRLRSSHSIIPLYFVYSHRTLVRETNCLHVSRDATRTGLPPHHGENAPRYQRSKHPPHRQRGSQIGRFRRFSANYSYPGQKKVLHWHSVLDGAGGNHNHKQYTRSTTILLHVIALFVAF